MTSVVDVISRLPALQAIEPEQATRIAELFSEEHFTAGETIHREGRQRLRLRNIQRGVVDIVRLAGSRPARPLITYGPGDALGEGILLEQFAVDVIQGGAGTSSNMNANEVIANRALELMGHAKGAYEHCRPNDDVNASQSTNDTYPTALKLAIMTSNQRLVAELKKLVEATQDTQGFVLYPATLKSLAVKMIKICNDLRLLASGPRAGFAEIKLPEKQPGSSIMPGKVNPVIPEVMNQICFKIIGNDLTVSLAAQAG